MGPLKTTALVGLSILVHLLTSQGGIEGEMTVTRLHADGEAPRFYLNSAVAGETHEYTEMYPGMAKAAREEGFEDIADWFETLAKAEKAHAGRFQSLLDEIS